VNELFVVVCCVFVVLCCVKKLVHFVDKAAVINSGYRCVNKCVLLLKRLLVWETGDYNSQQHGKRHATWRIKVL